MEWSVGETSERYTAKLTDTEGTLALTGFTSDGVEQAHSEISVARDNQPGRLLVEVNGQAQFAYPPTAATIRETYKAVKRCTQKGIAINTFMLDANQYLKEFMDDIARINGGRVFYTSPEKLGEYILVDYVQHKRKKLGGR